jgi:hypothetical protein
MAYTEIVCPSSHFFPPCIRRDCNRNVGLGLNVLWSVEADVPTAIRDTHRDHQIRIYYPNMYCMREGQIAINTSERPMSCLLFEHVIRINRNIYIYFFFFLFTCCL